MAADGDVGTVFAPLGQTYQDSCKLMTDDPEVTEHYSEESEDPIVVRQKKGKTTVTFQVMDPDTTTLTAVFGGTITGTGAAGSPKTWKAPDVTPQIERSIKITPLQGMVITIPRASIRAKIESDVSRKGIFLISITGVALKPNKAGVGSLWAAEPPTA